MRGKKREEEKKFNTKHKNETADTTTRQQKRSLEGCAKAGAVLKTYKVTVREMAVNPKKMHQKNLKSSQ